MVLTETHTHTQITLRGPPPPKCGTTIKGPEPAPRCLQHYTWHLTTPIFRMAPVIIFTDR